MQPKTSIIITTYNEAKTILLLLNALKKQTLKPEQIIIVDNYSTDQTGQIIKQFCQNNLQIKLIFKQKKGNRSIGRNYAIKLSKTELIAITDAGCIPHIDWLEQLVTSYSQANKKLKTKEIVVAGYYQGLAKTPFEQAVVPYVLVMPDKVNAKTFLPATRSMLLPKSVWQKLAGFNEQLSLNEDYDLAKRIAKNRIKIIFAPEAIVKWLPRKNLPSFIKMIYAFAKGDAQAKLWRPKVGLIFLRYILALILVWIAPLLLMLLIIIYFIWSIAKNIKYAPQAWYYLPLLQISSDLAVMAGTVAGGIK